jgi:hypothetical protein
MLSAPASSRVINPSSHDIIPAMEGEGSRREVAGMVISSMPKEMPSRRRQFDYLARNGTGEIRVINPVPIAAEPGFRFLF